MIVSEMYNGSGLGNQLWKYVVTRVIALDNGYEFGIKSPEKFKAAHFMNLDFGKPVVGGYSQAEGMQPEVLPEGIAHYQAEKGLTYKGHDVRMIDEDIQRVQDNTYIDGYFQGEDYIKHRKNEIREWLMPKTSWKEDACVIAFRGGEYKYVPAFFLTQKYWDDAIAHMKRIKPDMKFRVVTDDVEEASKFFKDIPISHDIEMDYSSIYSAKYLIISNSSFAWFPAWLNPHVEMVIAPKYYGRHNVSDGYWFQGYALTSGWMWMDREGKLFTYDECKKEHQIYLEQVQSRS